MCRIAYQKSRMRYFAFRCSFEQYHGEKIGYFSFFLNEMIILANLAWNHFDLAYLFQITTKNGHDHRELA
jgi:hypothetical protein